MTLLADIRARAFGYLSRREYVYPELFTKLSRKYPDNCKEIKQVLNTLQESGYLSEERYIKSYLNSKGAKFGLAKIRYTLKQKGATTAQVEAILKDNPIDEYAAAKTIWERKFGNTTDGCVSHADKQERAKQTRFLQSRGYSFEIINRVISNG